MAQDPQQTARPENFQGETPPTHAHVPIRGSDCAPILSFDEVPFFGSLNGIGRLTLAAQVLSAAGPDATISVDHIVTVHLRGSLRAMAALRDTIDKLLLAATPISGPEN